jgi:hypothetical protein
LKSDGFSGWKPGTHFPMKSVKKVSPGKTFFVSSIGIQIASFNKAQNKTR